MSSGKDKWNPPVDVEFRSLAAAVSSISLFAVDPPEHQWEGKYRLKQGDIFVEAGAFWGRYGLIASKRVGNNGRVILIEPHPYNINMIKNAIKTYSLSNVTLVEGAVWSFNGTINFCIEGNPASARKANDSDHQIIKVQAYTLDSLLPRLSIDHVDLLAADVEGAEVEMIKGAEKYLAQKRIKNLAVAAYHCPGFPEKIMETLKSHGYRDLFYSVDLPHYGEVVYAHV